MGARGVSEGTEAQGVCMRSCCRLGVRGGGAGGGVRGGEKREGEERERGRGTPLARHGSNSLGLWGVHACLLSCWLSR